MAFFQLVLKAKHLRSIRRTYHDEKLRSIEISQGKKVHLSLGTRIRYKKKLLKQKIRGVLKSLSCCPEDTWLHKKIVLLRTHGTLENYIFTSVFGFLGGIVLTYIFFIFFVFQLHFGLVSATAICSFLGVVFTLGLAFSPRIRCLVFLFLPQFFSKRGRQAMMAYAFILALSGPVKNSLYNVAILSESLSCGQEHLKQAVQGIIDLVKQPFYALRDSLAKIVKSLRAIVKRIRKILIAMKRLILSILQVIKSVFKWLGSIVSMCNAKLGTPYDRCQRMLEDAVQDCREKLGDVVGSVCSITYLTGAVCFPLKPIDAICVLVTFVSDSVIGDVRKKMKIFSSDMKAMFFVKVEFTHKFHFETNKSRSLTEISSAISREIKTKTSRFLVFFDWFSLFTSLFFIIIFLRAMWYRYKWLTSEHFDNHYILGHMREIDLRRARLDKETIFPLNSRERAKYAPLGSILLIQPERRKLAKSVVFLATASFKLAVYMLIDYCLFWLLDNIRYHGQKHAPKVPKQSYENAVRVKGQGFLADMYRSIVRAFSPYKDESELGVASCLPNPRPPNYDAYFQILTLVLLCWIMALFEPYGLRLRHVVLGHYYPDRSKQRAVWLYNHILRSRGSFLKFARRQLRRKFGIGDTGGIEQVTLRERLWAVLPVLNRLWPMKPRTACLVCGSPERDKQAPHIRCPTPSCIGVYCVHCFQDLRKLCTICMSPLDYGDLTDVSEERDSSDDQIDVSHLREKYLKAKSTSDKPKIPADDTKDAIVDKEETGRESEVSTPQNYVSDDDSSSKYSYSYQDEPSEDPSLPQKLRFKDVEAQEIRDDVTMQIFKEPSLEETSSVSEGRKYCFGIFKRKKRSKLRKKPDEDSGEEEVSKRSSIANTESWPTQEISDDEGTILEIELDDFGSHQHLSDQLLLEEDKKKTKQKNSIVKGFLNVFKRIIPFSKKKEKPSCQIDKDSIHSSDKSDSSDSFCGDDSYELLIPQEVEKYPFKSILRKRSNKNVKYSEDDSSSVNIPLRDVSCSTREMYNPREAYLSSSLFKTRQIPRHLESTVRGTMYFEVNESSSLESPRQKLRFHGYYSTVTDTQSSVDSNHSRDRPSSTCDGDDNDSYIYTSDNNDKHYHTEISDSSIPGDIDFSEFSSDISDMYERSYILRKYRRSINNGKKSFEGDKIDEDGNEKSGILKRHEFGKRESYDLLSNDRILNNEGLGIKQRPNDDLQEHKYVSTILESLSEEKTTDTLESDTLKNKVAKETANVKKRNSLKQVDSSDSSQGKAIQVREENIDDDRKKSVPSLESKTTVIDVASFEDLDQRRHRPMDERYRTVDQSTSISGFQPIIAPRRTEPEDRQCPPKRSAVNVVSFKSPLTSSTMSGSSQQNSTQQSEVQINQPVTRGQRSNIRSKSKKNKILFWSFVDR